MSDARANGRFADRIGMSTGALFPDYATEDALSVAAAHGFRVVEIYFQTHGEYAPAFVSELARRLDDLELRAHSLHNDTRHFNLWSDYRRRADESYALFERFIDIAAALGARAITWHGLTERLDDPVRFEQFAASARRLGEQAARAGVTLTIENVSWCYVRRVEHVQRLRDLALPIGFTFDPFQAAEAGEDPAAIIRAMGEQLTTVHLSDFGSGTIRHLPLGEGEIAWEPVFAALGDVGYSGPLIVEAPYRGNLGVLADGRDFVQRQLGATGH